MQRLARVNLDQQNSAAVDLFGHYDEVTTILLRHLPPSTATMLARPEVHGDVVEWYSELQGQPYLLGNSEREQQARKQAEGLISQRLATVDKLRAELLQKGSISAEQATLLERMVDAAQHDSIQIYIVNKQPVITGWGLGKKPIPVPPPVVPVPSKSRWWLWLLPLLLLLLGGLAWWLFFRAEPIQPEPIEPVKIEISKPEPPKEEPKPELPKEEPKPEPQQLEFIPESEEPSKVEELPKVEEPPKVEDLPKVEEPPKQEKPKYCTKTITPAQRPQMVIVFDDSLSMLASLNESSAVINAFWDRWNNNEIISEEEKAHMFREPRRLTTAKKAATDIIDKIDPNIDIGLVSLRRCPGARNHGMFGPSKRKALKAQIRGLFPKEGEENIGTALHSGLRQAAAMVDGVKRDAFILVLSDGEESCDKGNTNVCAIAQELAKQKPKLKINVVDIGGAKAANCLATETKGKVFTANSKAQVTNMINQAIKPMVEKEECK